MHMKTSITYYIYLHVILAFFSIDYIDMFNFCCFYV